MDRRERMIKCLSCGGVYNPVGPDGLAYYHVCPPLSAAELRAAVLQLKVVLPVGETADDAIQRRIYLRQQRRDETIVPNVDPTKPGTIKAAGKGTEAAPDPTPALDTTPVIVNV
jgi:hypothetical protein